MGLRIQAAADARVFLEDSAAGFGWPIMITDPSGTSAELTGFANDVGRTIDPQTGIAVTGRAASVALSIAALTAAGLALPKNVADGSSKPWVVQFEDVNGNEHTFKVSEAMPDRALGIVTCLLEAYKA